MTILRKTDWRVTAAVLLFGVLLYVPFAGSYGLWDPWETHYGEVARTMLQRNDFITTYWQDEVFKSKPVLTYWMQAGGMALFGLNQDGAPAGEMALSSAPEWGMRLPFVLVSIFCLFALYLLVARMVSKRAGVLTAIICATMPQYALVSRQSITDIPFVALMSAGLCFFLLGLFVGEDEDPPRYQIPLGTFKLSFTTWHLFSGALLLIVLPQLYLMIFDIGWLHHRSISLGTSRLQLWGLPYAVPWLALLGFYLFSVLTTGARKARHVYVHMAWCQGAATSMNSASPRTTSNRASQRHWRSSTRYSPTTAMGMAMPPSPLASTARAQSIQAMWTYTCRALRAPVESVENR